MTIPPAGEAIAEGAAGPDEAQSIPDISGSAKPTRLVICPDESHAIARPSFRRNPLQQHLDWLRAWRE